MPRLLLFPLSYPVFGKVTTGLGIVLTIQTVQFDRTDKPVTPVIMNHELGHHRLSSRLGIQALITVVS